MVCLLPISSWLIRHWPFIWSGGGRKRHLAWAVAIRDVWACPGQRGRYHTGHNLSSIHAGSPKPPAEPRSVLYIGYHFSTLLPLQRGPHRRQGAKWIRNFSNSLNINYVPRSSAPQRFLSQLSTNPTLSPAKLKKIIGQFKTISCIYFFKKNLSLLKERWLLKNDAATLMSSIHLK